MAARPRSHNIKIPNLYMKLDKRNGKIYYTYRNTLTGVSHGLGTDKAKAEKLATQANAHIEKQRIDQFNRVLDLDPHVITKRGVMIGDFVGRYISIQQSRLDDGDISEHTFKQRKSHVTILSDRFKNNRIKEIQTRDIALLIDEYKNAGKNRMAQALRSSWVDLFREAQHLGEVDSGFNPALSTRSPRVKIKRSRLTESNFTKILSVASSTQPSYIYRAMKIALTTGLRREDISSLQFTDVRDDHLFVSIHKSGGKVKLAFPLTLTNPLLNQNLGEIIAECRKTKVVSRFVIHHSDYAQNVTIGGQVQPHSLTKRFAKVRDLACIEWNAETPPSFHELRSLAERTYEAAGVNTQALLGHKNAKTTAKYHDLRGEDYIFITA